MTIPYRDTLAVEALTLLFGDGGRTEGDGCPYCRSGVVWVDEGDSWLWRIEHSDTCPWERQQHHHQILSARRRSKPRRKR